MDPPAAPDVPTASASHIVKGKALDVPRGIKQRADTLPDPIEDSDDDDDFQNNDPIDDDNFGDNGGNESTPQKSKAGLSRPKQLPHVAVEIPMSSSCSRSAPRARIDSSVPEKKEEEKAAIATGEAGLMSSPSLLTYTHCRICVGHVLTMVKQHASPRSVQSVQPLLAWLASM
jgi:hypothetical protein